jgi:thymidine kinase
LRLYNQEKIGEDYDYPMIAGYAKGTKFSIDDKLYDVDFEQCILSSRLGATEKMKRGIFSDRIISRNGNAIRNNNRIDSLKDKILFGMKGKHEWIDLYFRSNRGFDNIIVDEITFNNGDSIYIKAKIENNKIIPFIIHNSFGLN